MACRTVVPLGITLLACGLWAQDIQPAAAAKQVAAKMAKTAKKEVARLIEFDKVDRTIRKLPKLNAEKPLYGLLLFGLNGQHRVWAVLDKREAGRDTYDLLYLDRNADGDLTGDDERIVAAREGSYARAKATYFEIGDFRDPGSRAVHKEFQITSTATSVRIKMKWHGDKVTMGVFGPQRATYQHFADSPQKAPLLVPGHDRPFQFQHWMCAKMRWGQDNDFKVFMGNRGDRTGAFLCVDQKFLKEGEHVQATLIYTDTYGKQKSYRAKLAARC